MEKAIKVLNEMRSKGILTDYAIGGGIGTMFYSESFNTKDLDVFIYPRVLSSGLIHLGHIYDYLKTKGYKTWKQSFIIIEGVPVDFVVVYDELTAEALKESINHIFNGVKVKVMRPEHLIAIALKTGRPEDFNKVTKLLQQAPFDKRYLNSILKRHQIKWKR